MTKTVFVTGATGFIAKHIVLNLLNKGYNVVGGVRSVERRAEIVAAISPHLKIGIDLDTRLRVCELDLTDDAGWEEALSGADILMHTASPFPLENPKDEDELIKPAVEGTLRALRAAKAANINRVILTSSVVSISICDLPDGQTEYTEENWSATEGTRVTAYGKSKTLAERAAWDFAEDNASAMNLTVINPAFVLGPTLDGKFGSSMQAICRLLDAKDAALPDLGFPVVDVRDVAEMHVRAAETDASAGMRIIASGGFETFVGMAKILKAYFPDRRIITRQAPNFLVRVLALFDAQIRAVQFSLGRRDTVSNQRAREVLGMSFISTRDSVIEAAVSALKFRNG